MAMSAGMDLNSFYQGSTGPDLKVFSGNNVAVQNAILDTKYAFQFKVLSSGEKL